MRKILPLIALLLLPVVASTQESYSVPAPAQNVTTLTAVITKINGDLCVATSLARNCTQAALCVAAGVPGGSGCTPAQARAAKARIYPNTFAGREEFVTFGIALPKFLELVAEVAADQRRDACEKWTAASEASQNSACAALGLPTVANGCKLGCF